MLKTVQFEDENVNKKLNQHEDMQIIHVSQVIRRGRKVTVVEGLSTDYDYLKILKFFKKEFNCNGSMDITKKYFQLSGDHRKEVSNFFIEEGICDERNLKVHGA
jgi:translation initiation factor 1